MKKRVGKRTLTLLLAVMILFTSFMWNTEAHAEEELEGYRAGFDVYWAQADYRYDEMYSRYKMADSGKVLKNGWYKIDGAYCYFDGYGYASDDYHGGRKCNSSEWETGYKWIKSGSRWMYGRSVSDALEGFYRIDGKAYYFDETTGLTWKKGWHEYDGEWYYAKADGSLATGWLKLGSSYYFFDYYTAKMAKASDAFVNNFHYDTAKPTSPKAADYIFNKSGKCITKAGWVKTDFVNGYGTKITNWYYLKKGGAPVRGWKKIGKKWYYFDEMEWAGGALAANDEYYADGYKINKDGTCGKKGYKWHKVGKSWWYGKGKDYVKNYAFIDGKCYMFDSNGYLDTRNYKNGINTVWNRVWGWDAD